MAPLNDGEEHLVVAVEWLCRVEACEAAVEPAVGQLHRLLGVAVVGVARTAFVERHDDVGSDDALYVHHVLRRKKVF